MKYTQVSEKDIQIFNAVCDIPETGATKAAIARQYGVSPRTVGRAVDRVEKAIVEASSDNNTNSEVSALFGYHVNLRDIQATLDKYGIGEIEPCADVDEPNEEVEPFTYEIIGSSRSITITRSDGETRSLEASNKLFANVLEIVKSGLDNETLAEAFTAMNFSAAVQRYSDGMLLIDTESNAVVVYPNTAHEVVFRNSLADKLLSEVYNNIDGKDFKALTSFTKKLALADSSDVIAELFDFVSATDIEIDENGYVICWKRVRDNYMDIYSGTFDNSPGQVCEIPAHTVDPDRYNTCSHGLHVCSKSYLPHFGMTSGDRVVKVRVHPRDFIAIPNDYANAKARVSRYEVLEDVTDEMM